MEATIFNIQKFSLHDGPGIRTVVFFKGCPLACRWCANPESQNSLPELLRDKKKCARCGRCAEGKGDPAQCPAGALSLEGKINTPKQVFELVMQDREFYRGSGGGVTYSGGEPLLYGDFLTELSALLRREGIHIAAETTGFGSSEQFQKLCRAVDLLLFDVKHWDSRKHKEQTGVPNEQIFENLRLAAGQHLPIVARIPIIPGFNNTMEDVDKIGRLLRDVGIDKGNLLPFHQLGENKYALLGKPYAMAGVPSLHKEDLAGLLTILQKYLPQAKIGG
ncbi:MAG: glycyl-radical enzyme activating protein [Oscillospiraceae bacterium]